MICEINYDIFSRLTEIVIVSDDETRAYTFELVEHKLKECHAAPSSKIEKKFAIGFFTALASMLQRNGYLPEGATESELKATKFHLEDMRDLAFRGKKNAQK